MKKKLIVLFLCVALLFTFAACSGNTVASVNGEKITKDEYTEYVNFMLASYDQQYASLGGLSAQMLQYFDVQNTAIKALVTMEELKQACDEVGCSPTDDEIQSYVYDYFGATEKSDYEEAISKVKTQFGLSEDTVVDMIAGDLYMKNLKDYLQKQQGITFSKEEAEALYEADPDSYDNRSVSYILIKPDDTDATTDDDGNTVFTDEAWDAAKDEANEVIAKLDDGGDFAELAKEYSDDSSNASNGGTLSDPITKTGTSYDAEFIDAAFDLTKAGEYTEKPAKVNKFGYFVILCNGLQDADNDYDKLISSIVDDNLDSLKSDAYDKYIADFEEKSDITYYYGDKVNADTDADESDDASTDSK